MSNFAFSKSQVDLLQSVVTFTEDELKGVPKDVVSGYTTRSEDGKVLFDVTYKWPDINPVVSSNPASKL